MKRLALWSTVAAAAILRLGWPGLTEFKADEARLLAVALDMAELKAFAVRGIGSSVGLPNFPLSVWLISLPLFVWKHPYSATLFIAALNTLAVYLCYRITRRHWGEAAALAAALMLALSPWAVIYSRKIWAQNLLPIFVLAYAGCALASLVERRRWFMVVHLVALAAAVQIHLSGIALIPLTGLLLAVFWRRVPWREVALGLGAAALLAVPYAINVLPAIGGAGAFAAVLGRPATIDLYPVRLAWMVLTGADIHSLAGPAAFEGYLRSIPGMEPVRWLWGGLVLLGLLLALRRRRPADLILALWLVVPVLFFVRRTTPIFPHYFILILPAGYMLAGGFAGWLTERLPSWLKARAGKAGAGDLPASSRGWWPGEVARAGAIAILVASALGQAGAWMALLFYVGRVNTPGGFGTPLATLLDVAGRARAMRAEYSAPEILLVGVGDDPAVDEAPAVMDVLFRGEAHRFVDGNQAALLPQAGAVVIIQPGEFWARGWYERWAEAGARLGLRHGEGEVELAALPADAAIEIVRPFPQPRTLANGVELLGWEAEPTWTVIWRPGYIPPAADYHFFNHAPGGQADGAGYPSRYWRDGDLVVSFFSLRAPGAPVRVGMYEYPSVTNVPVMDEAGNPYSDAVTALP